MNQKSSLVQIPKSDPRALTSDNAVWVDKSRRESLTLLFIRFLAEQELC